MHQNNHTDLQRLWQENVGTEEDHQAIHWNLESYAEYSPCKPLDHWNEQPFLFLIGQAGAGKSSYLQQLCDDPHIVVIAIKEHGFRFFDVLENNVKWNDFRNSSDDSEQPLTLIIDGWDELVDEVACRTQLAQTLCSLNEACRSRFRLRLAARPEIPEQKILETLHNKCPWLMKSPQKRLILIPLYGNQIKELWNAYGNKKHFQEFWEWGIQKGITNWYTHVQTLRHLITSFEKGKEWKSTIELWKEILFLKIKEADGRKVDTLSSENSLLKAAGELALLYLLGDRSAIPHSDLSNETSELPTFCGLNRSSQRFLLSTPIFTPGGLENIHFAQAQEAEYLAAQRLHQANVGLDNLIRLLIRRNGVPEPLQGLCKWLARFDADWLAYLGKNHPLMAVQSLDQLTNPQTRDDLVRKWWNHPATNRNHRELIHHAMQMLPDGAMSWLESELQNLDPIQESYCLASVLSSLTERPIRSEFLNYLKTTLQNAQISEELISAILHLFSKKDFGSRDFWITASQQWLQTQRGERIPDIAHQLQKQGSSTADILALFQPVSPLSQDYRYTLYLENFFRSLNRTDLPAAIQWICNLPAQAFADDDRFSWAGIAYEGLLYSLNREQEAEGILTLAVHLWKRHASFHDILPRRKNIEELISRELLVKIQDTLIASDEPIRLFSKSGMFRDRWILTENGTDKILRNLRVELENHGYSPRADLLLDVARCSGVVWTEHLELLDIARQKREQKNEYSEQNLCVIQRLLGPVHLGSDEALTERRFYNENQQSLRQDQERAEKTEHRKKASWLEFYSKESEIETWDWFHIFAWLSFDYYIEQGYRYALPNDAFMKPFWEERLSATMRNALFEKAKGYLSSMTWQEEWTKDFAQRKQSSNTHFTTCDRTLAPQFAWAWLWHEMGEDGFQENFSKTDKNQWLQYLWAMEAYLHQGLRVAHCQFLCSDMGCDDLHALWQKHQELLGESALLPNAFLKCDANGVRSFLKNIFSIPFRFSSQMGMLQDYTEEHGSQLFQNLFDDWRSRQSSPSIEHWEQLAFLLRQGLESAWAWFLEYCKTNSSDAAERFKDIGISEHSRGIAAIRNWSETTLTECISVVLEYFPISTDPQHEGAYTPDWRDNVTEFRKVLYQILLKHGEWDLSRICRDLKERSSDFDPWGFVQQHALQSMANNSLVMLNAGNIADLLASNGIVVLKDEADFADWMCELLSEFEKDVLNGENGLVTLLWDEHIELTNSTLWREMKQEEAFSDLLLHWFRWRKLKSPLLPKREVQINRCSSRNLNPRSHEKGQRLDLDVEFLSPHQQLRLVFEVKRDKNREWKRDGLFQLQGYLQRLDLRYGIYIVYGKCLNGKDAMLSELKPIVEFIAAEGFHIIPVVIAI